MTADAGHSRSDKPKSKTVHGKVSVPVYKEKETPLQQVINLIGSGLQKREASSRVT